jgi:hypothetical protein
MKCRLESSALQVRYDRLGFTCPSVASITRLDDLYTGVTGPVLRTDEVDRPGPLQVGIGPCR